MKSLSFVTILLLIIESTAAYAYKSPPRHIVVIIMENKAYSSIIGSPDAPYINQLAETYSLATNYYAIEHPSLPNYLALVAGSDMGIHDDKEYYVLSGEFLGRQLIEANYSNRAFAESMPWYETSQSPCTYRTKLLYVKRHEPYAFWDWIQGVNGEPQHCSLVRPYSAFNPTSLKGFSFISPNVCNDMHDCSISVGDQWLQTNVPPILSNMTGNDFLVITWDEGSNGVNGGGQVATIVAGPGAKKSFIDNTFYNHYSLLRTVEDIFGLPCLNNACMATPMSNMLLTFP